MNIRQNNKPFIQQHRHKKNLLVLGIHSVIEAMNAGQQMDRICLQSNINSPEAGELKIVAENTGTHTNKVPFEKLRSFNIGNHKGCIAKNPKYITRNCRM